MTVDPAQSGTKKFDPKDTGTEYHSHMTSDGAPGSHSAEFGLCSDDGKDHTHENKSKQPGDLLAEEDKGTSGGGSDPTPAQPEAKTGGMADGSTDNAPAGAGTTQTTAEQGSGKVNPDKQSTLDKVNPFK